MDMRIHVTGLEMQDVTPRLDSLYALGSTATMPPMNQADSLTFSKTNQNQNPPLWNESTCSTALWLR